MDFYAVTLLFLLWISPAQTHAQTANTSQRSFVSYCATDGVYSQLPNQHKTVTIARVGEVELQADSGPGDDEGATFRFVQRGKIAFSFIVKDLSSSGVCPAIDPANDQLAVTYGRRRYQRGYVSTAKQNGKSFLTGGLPIYHMLAETELNPEAYGAAAAKLFLHFPLPFFTKTIFISYPSFAAISELSRCVPCNT